MRLLKDGRWKLTKAETARMAKDAACLKAAATLFLWGGATGGDRTHPKVVKASAALGEAISAWVRREKRALSRRGGKKP